MTMGADEGRNGCALHGALRLLDEIEDVVPILHASPGCGVGAFSDISTGGDGGSCSHAGETSATVLQEKQVVFGGASRLREQIKNTLKVLNGALYVVVTGCVPEVIGDDVHAMAKEAREQRFPVLSIGTPGFKGNAFHGYAAATRALFDQLGDAGSSIGIGEPANPDGSSSPPIPSAAEVNLLGIVPGQDPGWEGDLFEIEALLGQVGLRANRLVGMGQGVQVWARARHARLTITFSAWGAPAAQSLRDRHGVPWVHFGYLPVGSTDARLLLTRVGEVLGTDASFANEGARTLDGPMRHFLRRASRSLLLADIQKRIVVVAGSASAVGLSRFLSGTLGQIVGRVVVTDQPAEDERPGIARAIQSVTANTDVEFRSGRSEIAEAVRTAAPELILGSALESAIARDLRVPLLEVATPLCARPVFWRSYVGVRGAVTLVEDIVASLTHARASARPSLFSRIIASNQETRP